MFWGWCMSLGEAYILSVVDIVGVIDVLGVLDVFWVICVLGVLNALGWLVFWGGWCFGVLDVLRVVDVLGWLMVWGVWCFEGGWFLLGHNIWIVVDVLRVVSILWMICVLGVYGLVFDGLFPKFIPYFSASWKMKWKEFGFRPPLCTYRLNWARRTSWGWWDDWDDIVLQTQDSKLEPWRSEAEHATSRSRRLPTILTD